MKNLKTNIAAIIAITTMLFLGMGQSMRAQTVYKLAAGKDVSVKVLGSSNVHDWVMTSTGITSQGEFKVEGDALKSLSAFSFTVAAKSLKSEHDGMDTRTYKAINADKYPQIVYKLTSATITPIQKGKFLIKANGDLTISGATQNITLNVTATVNPDNSVTCTGSEKIKLTDYKIQPPSFMLGAMKVANDLTIQFNLIYKQ
jgi:polyisoprenoid-binding protein YceI